MQIIWKGGTHCELTAQLAVPVSIALDPQKKTKADIIVAVTSSGEGEGFLINGPGEYEIKDVYIERQNGGIIILRAEEIRVCYVFDQNLTDKDIQASGNVDILLVPIKDDPKKAASLVGDIEPRIVIPIDYKSETDFLKAMGVKDVEKTSKLTIKKKNLPVEETEVIVLTP